MERNEIEGYVIKQYISGEELLEGFSRSQFDFIFLDVNMPGLDGFETAGRIRDLDLKVGIVFVTYLNDFVQRGYNYNAKGYFYKPAKQQDIDNLMDRLLSERESSGKGRRYTLKEKKGDNVSLQLMDILYFESDNQYIITFANERKYTFRGKLDDVESELARAGFLRTHKSYLVNMKYVFKDFGDKVVLKSNESISLPVSRRYRAVVKEAFKGW